ncbi:RNA polymerase sigma factor [Asticcacaulis sp. 201]|uniref:RNA polymerase sigma factor n=1 Tax=Asticcacaulis sp. 201 TaxID=3028787 RepID=UPI00291628F0|nr:sigma-70 family RNA polymerase sigma factor [Asticcacaulis sp. 201]MDV6331149.1 sigma-70 family RNA polymerase sigma factor [Asticcacaulis sp. 201]
MISVLEPAVVSPPKPRVRVVELVNLNFLLERVANGDKPALKSLYDLISARLFSVLLRMVRRREVAEDLLQDVFVTVWCKAHQFDARRGNAEAWLFSMTRRKAIDRLRISYREVIGLTEDVATLEPQSDIYTGWNDTEVHMAVRHCMMTLKPDVNRALELCYKFGFTHEELAAELKVPVGTAKSWVRRGLAQLKDALDEYERT